MMDELFDELFKDSAIDRSLEHARKKDAILCKDKHDLVSLLTLISGHLDRCDAQQVPPVRLNLTRLS
jgi:hypothetical protein